MNGKFYQSTTFSFLSCQTDRALPTLRKSALPVSVHTHFLTVSLFAVHTSIFYLVEHFLSLWSSSVVLLASAFLQLSSLSLRTLCTQALIWTLHQLQSFQCMCHPWHRYPHYCTGIYTAHPTILGCAPSPPLQSLPSMFSTKNKKASYKGGPPQVLATAPVAVSLLVAVEIATGVAPRSLSVAVESAVEVAL